jgi:hypothetical protein
MASSSSVPPASPASPPTTGERLETPVTGSMALAEAVADVPVAFPSISREALSVAPPSSSGEANDSRESFTFPLMDPWYEIFPLFPYKSFDFCLPLEDWDWTVTAPEVAVDQAWVPCLDEISDLLIQKGDIRPVPISFEFPCAAFKDWSHWVDLEILDSEFWDNLRKAGIHWSILISQSCGMFRDTEPLHEVLRRWCPTIHTFFFAWGELTLTLEDIANHWMLPILGEFSPSDIKLSAEEEEIAVALRGYSSTRITGWPALFLHHGEVLVRRAAFIVYWLSKCIFGNSPYYTVNTLYIPLAMKISTGCCFPLAPMFLGHLYSQLDLLHDCEVEGDSCYSLLASFNTTVLQTFLWEHSASYIFAAKDKVAAWSKFADLLQRFFKCFPDFRKKSTTCLSLGRFEDP